MGNPLTISIVFGVSVFWWVFFAAWAFGWLDVEVKNDLEAVRRRE